ncbi:hypothetical protein BDR07DRAFT_285671 [Suillus spraguei]|nr:hypothetical protein BDR07DRAFT_285671 [Suillus spraguei]
MIGNRGGQELMKACCVFFLLLTYRSHADPSHCPLFAGGMIQRPTSNMNTLKVQNNRSVNKGVTQSIGGAYCGSSSIKSAWTRKGARSRSASRGIWNLSCKITSRTH